MSRSKEPSFDSGDQLRPRDRFPLWRFWCLQVQRWCLSAHQAEEISTCAKCKCVPTYGHPAPELGAEPRTELGH